MGYVEHETDRWVLNYYSFHLDILDINGRSISEWSQDTALNTLLLEQSDNGGFKLQSISTAPSLYVILS